LQKENWSQLLKWVITVSRAKFLSQTRVLALAAAGCWLLLLIAGFLRRSRATLGGRRPWLLLGAMPVAAQPRAEGALCGGNSAD
jgi:hypothetical protein